MPKVDGYEATRRLREVENKTPVIAMTAHAMVGDKGKCLQAGMDDYLSKPISLERLAECLERWLPSGQAYQTEDAARKNSAKAAQEFGFDDERFLQLMMGDADLADTIIDMFLANTPGEIDTLKHAIAADDGEQTRHCAHFIKGAAANLCASDIYSVASRIEHAAGEANHAQAVALAAMLDASWKNSSSTRESCNDCKPPSKRHAPSRRAARNSLRPIRRITERLRRPAA